MQQKMYSIVVRHLSGIQKGIQHGHSKDEYEFFNKNERQYQEWLENYKTVIVLETYSCQLLRDAKQALEDNGIEVRMFYEPDLDNIPTSISFLVDETVWDKENYPTITARDLNLDARISGKEYVNEQVLIANQKQFGNKVAFLKTWLPQFNLATN